MQLIPSEGFSLEKYGKIRWIWTDWGNTAQADMAGLRSLGLEWYEVAFTTSSCCAISL